MKKVLDIKESEQRIQSHLESFRYNRKKNNDFNLKSRSKVLNQENHKLVKKIEGIHFRPPPQFSIAPEINLKPGKIKIKRNSATQKHGSLNYFVRKQENDRIFQENMILY